MHLSRVKNTQRKKDTEIQEVTSVHPTLRTFKIKRKKTIIYFDKGDYWSENESPRIPPFAKTTGSFLSELHETRGMKLKANFTVAVFRNIHSRGGARLNLKSIARQMSKKASTSYPHSNAFTLSPFIFPDGGGISYFFSL